MKKQMSCIPPRLIGAGAAIGMLLLTFCFHIFGLTEGSPSSPADAPLHRERRGTDNDRPLGLIVGLSVSAAVALFLITLCCLAKHCGRTNQVDVRPIA